MRYDDSATLRLCESAVLELTAKLGDLLVTRSYSVLGVFAFDLGCSEATVLSQMQASAMPKPKHMWTGSLSLRQPYVSQEILGPLKAPLLKKKEQDEIVRRVQELFSFADQIEARYDRPQLARIWGYAGFQAFSRGVFTPRNSHHIVLFITKDKQDSLTQYQDRLEGDTLYIEGPTDHAPDERIIASEQTGDEVHLFYRERHHSPFTYYGQLRVLRFERRTDAPSHFEFRVNRWEIQAQNDISTETRTQSDLLSDEGRPEGAATQRTITTYERSPENRARALEIHGNACAVCGFEFDAFYGAELARGFIQVHHLRSITEQGNRPVNPREDLAPLCSNCHSMTASGKNDQPVKTMPQESVPSSDV